MREIEFTRSQRQEYHLEQNAKLGEFYAHLKLYPSERKRLEKKGFVVIPSQNSNEDIYCIVTCLHAFPKGIPQIVLNNLLGIVKSKVSCENYAQELFCIAFKKSYSKEK